MSKKTIDSLVVAFLFLAFAPAHPCNGGDC